MNFADWSQDPTKLAVLVAASIPTLYIWAWLLLMAHLAGHVVAGWLMGFRIHKVRLGCGRGAWSWRLGQTAVLVSWLPYGGLVVGVPRGLRLRHARSLIFTLGGLVASVGMVLLAWSWSRPGFTGNAAFEFLAAMSKPCQWTALLAFVLMLCPYRSRFYGGLYESDGLQAFRDLCTVIGFRTAASPQDHVYKLEVDERLEEAIAYCREFLRTDQEWEVQDPLWDFLLEYGFVDEVLEDCWTRLQALPETDVRFAKFADGLACYTLVEMRRDWFERATQRLRVAVVHHPGMITLYGVLGALLFEQGHQAEARPLLERTFAGSDTELDRGLCSLYLACYAQAEGDESAARRLAREAHERLSNSKLVQRVLGGLNLDLNEPPPPGLSQVVDW